jgi:hypothetical protein
MASRLKLHEELCTILGNRNVYFQPPESVKLSYPAIVYSLSNIDNVFANNSVYMQKRGYEVTLIVNGPDSELVETLSTFPMCRFDRHFKADNLNQYVFTLYY